MATNIDLPTQVVAFLRALHEAGYSAYVVGGGVRDALLGRPTSDWDFATNATPGQIMEVFPDSTYENRFGTVLVKSFRFSPAGQPHSTTDVKTAFEVTPYRREGRYADARHPESVDWAETVEEDLGRRDFTINAMAFDGEQLVDVTGGQQDLADGIIRAVGDPKKRFEEDALRMIRAVRFAAQLGFQIEQQTLQAILACSSNITRVSWERIQQELYKILSVDNASHAADAILTLKNTGLLEHILPELYACFNVEQISPERHHKLDVGTHLVESLRNCPSEDPVVRLGALLHDIGKAETRDVDEQTGIVSFHNHEIVGAQMAHDIAQRLRLSKEDNKLLTKIVRYHMFSVGEGQTDKAVRRFIRRVGKDHIQDMLDVRTADRLGSGAAETSWRTELFKKRIEEVQKKPFEVKDLAVNGQDVMKTRNMKPGPAIGTILNTLFDEVVDGKLKNEREVLLQRMEEISVEPVKETTSKPQE